MLGFFKNIFASKQPSQKGGGGYLPYYGGGMGAVGINQTTASSLSTFYACIAILSKTVAMLPAGVQRLAGDHWVDADDHALKMLLKYSPNPQQTPFEFFSYVMKCLLVEGNAYVLITRDSAGNVTRLDPLSPALMVVTQDPTTYNIVYTYNSAKTLSQIIPPQNLLHFKDFSFDGVVGQSKLMIAAKSLNMGLAVQKAATAFFQLGSKVPFYVEVDGTMVATDDKIDDILNDVEQYTTGGGQSPVLVFEKDQVAFKNLGGMSADAVNVDAMRLVNDQICAFYHVPPHMVGNLDRATYGNIEEQDLNFQRHTIEPWLTMICQEMTRKLLYPAEWGSVRVKIDSSSLVKGNLLSRINAMSKALLSGAITVNEFRDAFNYAHLSDGDERFIPLNVVTSEGAVNENT